MDGLLETKRHWDGELVSVHAPRTRPDTNLDQRPYSLAELPFRVVVRPYDADIDGLVQEASLVMLSPFQRPIAAACRRLRKPYCVVAEYNLGTRISIASEVPRLLPRAKQMVAELVNEV